MSLPESFEVVLEALNKAKIEVTNSEVTMLPQNYIKLEGKEAGQMVRLIEALEDHEDVQHVYSNFDIDEKEMEALAS